MHYIETKTLTMHCLVDKEHRRDVEILYLNGIWYKGMVNVINFTILEVVSQVISSLADVQ